MAVDKMDGRKPQYFMQRKARQCSGNIFVVHPRKTLPQSCPTRSLPSTLLCLRFRIVFIQANSRDVHFSAFLPSTLILMAVRDARARASFPFIDTAAPVCLRRRKRCRSKEVKQVVICLSTCVITSCIACRTRGAGREGVEGFRAEKNC